MEQRRGPADRRAGAAGRGRAGVARRDALFVRTRRGQPNGLAAALGCELTAGGTIITDGEGRTTVARVYAAGDAATDRLSSVAAAIGTGSRAALAVSLDHM